MKHIRKYTHLKEEEESPQEFCYTRKENEQVILSICNDHNGVMTFTFPKLHLAYKNKDAIIKQLIELGMPGIAEWLREFIRD